MCMNDFRCSYLSLYSFPKNFEGEKTAAVWNEIEKGADYAHKQLWQSRELSPLRL